MIGDGSTLSDEKKPCQKCWSHFDSADAAESSYRPKGSFNNANNQINDGGRRHWKRHAAGGDSTYRTPFINPRDGRLDSESFYTVFLDAIGK